MHLLSRGEQDTFFIMGRTRYICYHGENKIHLLSWGEQDTFAIMGRTRYIYYREENKIHLLSWGEQDAFDDNDVCFVLDQHSELDFNSASSVKQESVVKCRFTQTHYSSSEPTSLYLYSLVLLSREAINTNVIVFGLT